MNKTRDYHYGDILQLTDTRVVRFIERGTSDKDVLIVQVDRLGTKDIIREHQVEVNQTAQRAMAYGRK